MNSPLNPLEARAWLRLNGWHGYSEQEIQVVGETPKRWRIQTVGKDFARLAGRRRYLFPGQTVLVPKTAVRFGEARR